MKNKIIAVIDIFLGLLFSIEQMILLIFVYPRMAALYNDFDTQLPPTTRYFPIYSVIFIILFAGVILIGIKLLKKPTDKLFKLGVAGLIIMLLFAGYAVGISVIGLISPIYNLSTAIQ